MMVVGRGHGVWCVNNGEMKGDVMGKKVIGLVQDSSISSALTEFD